jgi:peptidoglycan/xylan/chitin deacetylase (PgdA/CDA1 family)
MLLRHARHALLQIANAVGVTRLVAGSEWRRSRLVILCYHGISLDDEHRWNPELYMPATQFRGRMRRLREARYTVLPLAEAVQRLYDGTLPPKSVAVTFDDGSYDFFARALPIVREFDIPVTNFVATFYSRFPRPVFDPASAYLLWKGRTRRGGLDLGAVIAGARRVPIATSEERAAVWQLLAEHARRERLTAAEKDDLLAQLAAAVGIDYAAWTATRMLQQMREDELRALPRNLVDVQLHTHRHRMPADRSLFVREITDNREALEDFVPIARPRAHFCYPSGGYSVSSVRWLAELDVQSALTCDPDICTGQDHPLLLPRWTDTAVQPEAVFDGWVSGFYPRLCASPRLRERRRLRRNALVQAPEAPASRDPRSATLPPAGVSTLG